MPSESSVPPQTTLRTHVTEPLALTERQAEDDGLWFVAETASEAYLQQELRRLTAVVEWHAVAALAILDGAKLGPSKCEHGEFMMYGSIHEACRPIEPHRLIPDPRVAGLSPSREPDDEMASFYEVSRLLLGARIHDRAGDRAGSLVRRAARNWVDRDTKPPMVRWDGKIDAVEVPWQCLKERESRSRELGVIPASPPDSNEPTSRESRHDEQEQA